MHEADCPKALELSGGLGCPTPPAKVQEHLFDIDNLLDAFMQVNREGVVDAWNLQAEESFGWSCTEAVGRIAAELVIPCW